MKKVVEVAVAVAVLCYDGCFLVARRASHQHQGGKLEFVGGKVEKDESDEQALVREVKEELGLDIGDSQTKKLGEICHDYGDKVVRLLVYQVWLSETTYRQSQDERFGRQGQPLYWLTKEALLALADEFPKANQTIFGWL